MDATVASPEPESRLHAPSSTWWLVVGGLALVFCWMVWASASNGGDPAFFCFFAGSLAAVGAVVSLTLVALGRNRRRALQFGILLGVFAIASAISVFEIEPRARRTWLIGIAARASPLIDAIRLYENSNGCPPPDLNALVPHYIASIPSTGYAEVPEFDFTRLDANECGASWELGIDCSLGFMNWDRFFYRPNERYGEEGRLWNERIGTWAYLHE